MKLTIFIPETFSKIHVICHIWKIVCLSGVDIWDDCCKKFHFKKDTRRISSRNLYSKVYHEIWIFYIHKTSFSWFTSVLRQWWCQIHIKEISLWTLIYLSNSQKLFLWYTCSDLRKSFSVGSCENGNRWFRFPYFGEPVP